MNLILNLEEELSILDRYGLTPNELLVIKCLLLLQDEDRELFSRLLVIIKRVGLNLREILISLQEKEIILKSYKICEEGKPFDPYAIPINKNFIKNLYKASFEMGKELFETYPQFGYIGESVISLRGVSKKFDSLEDAYFRYGKMIGWNLERHNYIIELVKWAKDNNLINFSLASFIIDQRWLDLEAMRNGDKTNVNFNSIKLL